MIKLLIFDFDGTISDARAIARKNLFFVLDKREYKYDKKKAEKLLGVRMPEILQKLRIPESKNKEIRKEFYDLMIKDTIKLHECVSIKPLKELRKECRLIIVSNSESRFLLCSAKKLKVIDLFHEFYGAEKFKTKDKEIRYVLKKYKLKGNEAMYIGDRFSDVECAKKAKVISVAIHNNCSWSSLDEVIKTKPDFIINNFHDLKNLVEKLNLIERALKEKL